MNKSTVFGLILVLFSSASLVPASSASTGPASFYEFKVNSITGTPVELGQYKGKVLLVVNTASNCGYTPQYEGLQTIYQRYHDKGFEILAFPSNDFGSQEPGTAPEIKKFCETRYKVSFPLFEKNPVSGSMKQPLYDWLVHHEPRSQYGTSEVGWNFEKFLISKEGKVLARFKSRVTPESPEIIKAIEGAMKNQAKR